MGNKILQDKSFLFSVEAIKLYKNLIKVNEFILSKQFVRSSTSIGANIVEAFEAESDRDFLHKLSISLKEARETEYWLRILKVFHKDVVTDKIINHCSELISILIVIIRSK